MKHLLSIRDLTAADVAWILAASEQPCPRVLEGKGVALMGDALDHQAGRAGPDMGVDADRRIDGRQGEIGPDQRHPLGRQPFGEA